MSADKVFADKPKEGQPWDVAIIGSGPASFTAAIYTTRGAASTLIIGGESWGGQLMLTTEVDNFPSQPGVQGPELMSKMKDHALLFGGEMVTKKVESVDFSDQPFKLRTGSDLYTAKSVIIATGADTRWLGVPGEEKFRGRGVSSCAPCDAPFFKDKKVVVVGGGDSAMEEALVLTKYATNVIIVHRRDEFKASAAMQQRVFDKQEEGKIEVLWDTEVVEVLGDQLLEKLKLSTKSDSKHLENIKNEKIKKHNGNLIKEGDNLAWELPADGVFVAIGHVPATDIYKGQVELDQKGYVVKHAREGFSMATSVEGVFVAGDVHDYHYRQAVTAAGFGCMAGMDALKYLDQVSK